MIKRINPNLRYPIISTLLILNTTLLHAGCPRDDVDYYLSKGFTTAQITIICSTKTNQKSNTSQRLSNPLPPNSEKKPTPTFYNINQTDDIKRFLEIAIQGDMISISDEALFFTRKVCIEYDEEDNYGFKPTVCPQIKFEISRHQLEILTIQHKSFFSNSQQIEVKSQKIKREIIDQLTKLKPQDKQRVFDQMEQGEKTWIPIRPDIALSRVKYVFKQLRK